MSQLPLHRVITYSVIGVFLVCLSTVLLAELLLRLCGFEMRSVHTASADIFDRIPGMYEPGQDLVARAIPDLPHHVTINSLGYRGSEPQIRAHPVRILCIGDSFTFGDNVHDDETFPYSLQKIFDRQSIAAEVINGGMVGTTIVDHVQFVQKSMRMNPDIVVLTFSENDVTDLALPEPMYVLLERNRQLKSNPMLGTFFRLFRDTAVFNFVLRVRRIVLFKRIQQTTRARIDEAAGQSSPDRPTNTSKMDFENCDETLWKKYERHFQELHTYLSSHSIPLLFVIYPSHYRWTRPDEGCGAFNTQLDRVERLAKDRGVATLNLLPTLKQSHGKPTDLYLLPHDGHPSKLAYQLAATAIYESLQKNFHEAWENSSTK